MIEPQMTWPNSKGGRDQALCFISIPLELLFKYYVSIFVQDPIPPQPADTILERLLILVGWIGRDWPGQVAGWLGFLYLLATVSETFDQATFVPATFVQVSV